MHLVGDLLLLLALFFKLIIAKDAAEDPLRLADDNVFPRRVNFRFATLALGHGPRLASVTTS